MKYIITGGAGFIGSSLAEELIAKGKTVWVIDDLSTGSVKNLSQIIHHSDFNFILGDAGIQDTWNGVLSSDDVIIHLSATVGVTKVCEDPLRTINNNFKSTEKILDLALINHNKVFLGSTSEVYGDTFNKVSYEDDPVQVLLKNPGRSAYVLGKLMSEHHCLSYYKEHNLPVIVARFFNVIGPRQASQYGMVVPTFVKQAMANKPITVFGDGYQQRSFCDINDITRAIWMLLENDNAIGEIFNVGSPESVTIAELAEFIKRISNSNSPITYFPFPSQRSGGSDIRYRRPCISKIKSKIGWSPGIPWQKAIADMLVPSSPYHEEAKLICEKEEFAAGNTVML